jgi:hypothetical protein
MFGIFINIERENALEKGHESKGNRPQLHLSEIRIAGEIHRQDSIINFHCFWGGGGAREPEEVSR